MLYPPPIDPSPARECRGFRGVSNKEYIVRVRHDSASGHSHESALSEYLGWDAFPASILEFELGGAQKFWDALSRAARAALSRGAEEMRIGVSWHFGRLKPKESSAPGYAYPWSGPQLDPRSPSDYDWRR